MSVFKACYQRREAFENMSRISSQKGTEMNTLREQYIVNSKGKRTAVILPIDQYEQLLEDLHDLAVVAERRAEKTISLEEIKRRIVCLSLAPSGASCL